MRKCEIESWNLFIQIPRVTSAHKWNSLSKVCVPKRIPFASLMWYNQRIISGNHVTLISKGRPCIRFAVECVAFPFSSVIPFRPHLSLCASQLLLSCLFLSEITFRIMIYPNQILRDFNFIAFCVPLTYSSLHLCYPPCTALQDTPLPIYGNSKNKQCKQTGNESQISRRRVEEVRKVRKW